MPAALLRAIGHFIFFSQLLPIEPAPAMGQQLSTPTQADRKRQTITSRSLYRTLRDGCKECFITQREWLPLDVLDNCITPQKIRDCTALEDYLCADYDVKEIIKNSKRVFAVLVLSDCHSITEEVLLEEQLTDGDLPLTKAGDDGCLKSTKNGKYFHAFAKLGHDAKVDAFLREQWLVMCPVFGDTNVDPEDRSVRILHGSCPLPFGLVEHLTSTNTSHVYKCELHPAHSGTRVEHNERPILVAVKKFFGKDMDEDFNKELQNLIDIRKFKNDHLIKHIDAWKADPPPGTAVRCLVFPFARGGDLCAFWEKSNEEPRTAKLVKWSLEQMYGLATGIRDLHGGFGKGTNVRHGDLKPENLLLFEGRDRANRLVIADVGIAKVHMGPTAVRTQKGTGTSATTRAYEAPEANDETGRKDFPRSRAYDIWSLGCIFFEFVIWLLYDIRAVDNFATRRPHKWTGHPGGFYEISDSGVPAVCHQATRGLNDLLDDERCGEDTALGRLVRLIAHYMLVAEVDKRCYATELVDKLANILAAASNGGDAYLMRPVGNTVVPEMFTQLRRGSSFGSMTR